MTRTSAWIVHLAVVAAGVTGLIYGWMRYFAVSDDPFAIVNHPWEPDLKAWHIVVAPVLVFAVGLLWRSHVWGRIRSGHTDRRASGIALAVLVGPMVASGYALQVTDDELWREIWIWTHGLTATVWLAIYVAHQSTPRRPHSTR